ncbi:MAG TPA: PfkB family carbohydrate kinase, partial [Marmoricola sp.]|nr:PfkB family carbohydrate kinase [Marmoricola sp.]
GRRLEHLEDQVRAAREYLTSSHGTAVVLSRGHQGVVVVTAGASEVIGAHPTAVVNTVGAGDALVAGIVAGLCRGWALTRAARFGVACSAAMTGTAGTALFTRADLRHFTDEDIARDPGAG